ncbi:chaperonin 10-like protein [Podospora didyma]|uniref:Chaperonin 10-like protein n=1 Tax=Podospora didyma TaxID=330526 RepID=A0AAE0P4T3_9PEZI|nr:chaperonin 10-like protein [Podospora didyma]
MSSLPKTFKAAAFTGADLPLKLQDFPLQQPAKGHVLIKTLACGICHSDAWVQTGGAGSSWPLIPGHEVIGDVVAVGDEVTRFKLGDRVGGGWHGGHDGTCRACQRGYFQNCDNQAVNGVTRDGGYAEYTLLRAEAAVRIPAGFDAAEAAPFLCAGTTVFNAIRKMHVEQGNIVAVQGLGGLGHLAVQFARAMGYHTIAISRGTDKRDFAFELGAHEYIDTNVEDPAEALQKLGGAALIVSTAPNPAAVSPLLNGLQARGKLVPLAPVGPVQFDTTPLIVKGLTIAGWPSGHALDGEETLAFAQRHGIKCLVERFPLSDASNAFELMKAGKPRFRNVIVME